MNRLASFGRNWGPKNEKKTKQPYIRIEQNTSGDHCGPSLLRKYQVFVQDTQAIYTFGTDSNRRWKGKQEKGVRYSYKARIYLRIWIISHRTPLLHTPKGVPRSCKNLSGQLPHANHEGYGLPNSTHDNHAIVKNSPMSCT